MAKFITKPVVVEAEQFDEEFFIKYYGTAHRTGFLFVDDHLIVRSPRGEIRAERGDWIVTGVDGEKSVYKPDTFEAVYEPAEDGPEPLPGLEL